jgi:acyl carrier protein
MPDLKDLEDELRRKLTERLGLGHLDPGTIASDTPLFKGGLELDSLDALEITVLVEEEYGIVIGVAERTEAVFGTLGSLAAYVRDHFQRDAGRLPA